MSTKTKTKVSTKVTATMPKFPYIVENVASDCLYIVKNEADLDCAIDNEEDENNSWRVYVLSSGPLVAISRNYTFAPAAQKK